MHPVRQARAALIALLLIIALLVGGIVAGQRLAGWGTTPKLALDLEGGTQVILSASTADGSPVTQDALDDAIEIMSQRINALGVAETSITSQGGDSIVIDVPGQLDPATSQAIRQTALMEFRPVILQADPAPVTDIPADALAQYPTEPPAAGTDPTDPAWATQDVVRAFFEYDCTDPATRTENTGNPQDQPLISCAADGSSKYLLGPVAVPGSDIADASASPELTAGGGTLATYQVNLIFNDDGAEAFREITTTLSSRQGSLNQFAIVLDGNVVQAPAVNQIIPNGEASITGGYTQEQAQAFADQLRFGALPLQFDVQSEQQISSTLGDTQLRNALLAGLGGLVLVMLWALFQYRALGFLISASLAIAGGLTYSILVLLSQIPDIGYRLSLAGIAGIIVAIGFTADSFVVYFERIRDEIREGRGLVAAVEHGWERGRRTIVVSDAVNVVAAVILYLLSVGNVRGFAFTLGLTTLVDLVVVFLFSHPMMRLLARTRFFGDGHPASGLDPRQYGRDLPAYAGRGRVRTAASRRDRSRDESAEEPLTIAQRKAAERRGASGTGATAAGTAPSDRPLHQPQTDADTAGRDDADTAGRDRDREAVGDRIVSEDREDTVTAGSRAAGEEGTSDGRQ